MIYENIYITIKCNHDKELEIEWIDNFIMNAIIKQATFPLIYIYAFKKFNFFDQIKHENETKYNQYIKDIVCSIGYCILFICQCILFIGFPIWMCIDPNFS